MLEAEYRTMFSVEQTHWWYRGLRDLTLKALARIEEFAPCPRILDAGCGTGRTMKALAEFAPVGLDLSPTALSFTRQRGDFTLVRGSAAALPFRKASFDVVVSLDVLANLPVALVPDAFAECFRVLAPGGALILNLVAFQSLFSEHDRAVGVVRRFRVGEVRELLSRAGFSLELLTYANAALFFPAALVRLWRKRRPADGRQPHSDLALPPGPINALLTRLRFLENDLIVARRIRFPFGLSVFALARKPR